MDDYEKAELEKVWAVIRAASLNSVGHTKITIGTAGSDPHCRTTVDAYVLKKFLNSAYE